VTDPPITEKDDADMFRKLGLLGRAAMAACIVLGWAGAGTASAQSACADLGGSVGTDQICHVRTAGATYKIAFDFPVDYPDQQPVADYLKEEQDGFIEFSRLPEAKNYATTYQLLARGKTYRSTASGTTTLLLRMGQDAQPHPRGWFKAFNYNLNTHTPITLDTLFKPGADPLAVLNPLLVRKFGPLPQGEPGVEAYKNFAITDDAVIFFFDQGQILGHADGELEMPVARGDLAALLAV
jgi:Protein of unknown function (DUF3298)